MSASLCTFVPQYWTPTFHRGDAQTSKLVLKSKLIKIFSTLLCWHLPLLLKYFFFFFTGLLSKILVASPKVRITVADLQKDRWYSQGKSRCRSHRSATDFKVTKIDSSVWISAGVKQPCLGSGNKTLRTDVGLVSRNRSEHFYEWSHLQQHSVLSHLSWCSDDRVQFSSSQPDFAAGDLEAVLVTGQTGDKVSFSQPVKPEHMLLGSQLLGTPGASQVISRVSWKYFISGKPCNLSYFSHPSPDTAAKTGEKTDPFLHHRERWCFFKRLEKCLRLLGTSLQTLLPQSGTSPPGSSSPW